MARWCTRFVLQPVDGPALFNSTFRPKKRFLNTLLNQNGSTVVPGNLLLIPVENSLLYVRPLYIEATGTTAVPELQLVIVGVGPEVVIADSFEAALASAIPGLNVDLESEPSEATSESATPQDDALEDSTDSSQNEEDTGVLS